MKFHITGARPVIGRTSPTIKMIKKKEEKFKKIKKKETQMKFNITGACPVIGRTSPTIKMIKGQQAGWMDGGRTQSEMQNVTDIVADLYPKVSESRQLRHLQWGEGKS